jgi:UrcA family protein
MTRLPFAIAAAFFMTAAVAQAAPANEDSLVVHGKDLHLSQPADAQRMLRRLEQASMQVCGSGFGSARAVQEATLRSDCYAQALSHSVARVNAPALNVAFAAAYPSNTMLATAGR